jgi:acyl-CoA synthetase (AMP-forming)/AMP-acid ligase II
VVLYQEVRPGLADPDVEAISRAVRRAVGDALNLPLHAVVLVAADTLPRTGVGKIRRFLCRQEFLDNREPA